jgi:hypothetical protein
MKIHFVTTTILLLSGLVNSAVAQVHMTASQWDRSSALASVRTVNIELAIDEISDLKDIQSLENRSDWPLPAREAAIYQYTQSLATASRDTVDVDLMQYLGSYQAQVLVPHEDHQDAAVPLFNIRAAAVGVENGWLRGEATAKAQVLLEADPAALPDNFLKSESASQQFGILDAVQQADLASVQTVQLAALDQLGASPELTRLVAVTAAITADPYAARRLLIDGSGTGLAAAMHTLGKQSSSAELAALLKFGFEQAPTANAALAIAAWWPVLRHDAETRQLLINNLDDPALGSSVALALAQSPDIQTIRELQLTADGDSIAARRAQMALNMSRDGLLEEVRQ